MLAIRENSPGSCLHVGRILGRGFKYVKHNSLIELAFQKVKMPHSLTRRRKRKGVSSVGGLTLPGVKTQDDSFNKYLLSAKPVLYTLATLSVFPGPATLT